MTRMQRAVVLLSLIERLRASGSWCGETHIQKATYFLQELLEVPLGFDFILYKHGPFSFDLSDEITALRADLLLNVQVRPPYGASLLPSEGSRAFLERYPMTRSQYAARLQFVAEWLGGKNVADLERIATALYVTRESGVPSAVEARAARLHALKPHVPLEAARQALREVDAMAGQARDVLAA